MREFNSEVVQNKRLLPGIHGLRGVASLAVVLYHLIHIGGINPPSVFGFIGRDFGYSVHLFFILSAYSLMYSTESKVNQPSWVLDYFIKRIFRIAPLFYFMIICFIGHGVLQGNGVKDITNIILNITFTFGFVPASGIVWGGWSVGVEMIFYAIFPVLLLLIKTQKAAFIFLIFSIVSACALRSALHFQFVSIDPLARFDWSYFSFASNMCFFAMGIYAYLLSKQYRYDNSLITIIIPTVVVVIICGLLFTNLGPVIQNSYRFDIVLWGVGLMALCIWQSVNPSSFIANSFFEYMGERSFSIYLLHPVIIVYSKNYIIRVYEFLEQHIEGYAFFVCGFLLSLLVVVVAEITYRLIEVRGIRLGQMFIKQRREA